MGLNVKDIIPKKEIELKELNGKVVCVDAFNALYQFLSSIRQVDGTPLMDSKKRVTSHLSGLFYRNIKLLEEGIKLIYVFDGKPPDLKGKTHDKRDAIKEVARGKYAEAKASDDIESMRRYSSQLARLNDEMIRESKDLLEAMGIMVVQAPSEGESQAAYLVRKKPSLYAVGSQDYDSLLFGASYLIQNLTLARKRRIVSGWVEVKPQLIDLEHVFDVLEISRDQLICLAILVGTDYNPKGIPGIGQKKALDIVRKYKQPVLIFKAIEEQIMSLSEEDRFDWKEIFELFHKPDVIDVEIDFPKINEDKIKDLLIREHEFSEDRVNNHLEKLHKIKEKSKQKDLKKWF